ncbi:MAG TPA: 30S ribosomal protein S13 [archaeon]|nr:30S ribosomal protein S13 [archaeon]
MAQETRRIVRVLTTDIDGNLNVERGLRKIKGVRFMFSRATCIAMGIDPKRKLGDFNDHEIKAIEAFIKKPELPAWMLNRRKDPETGANGHVTMSDLDLRRREDINNMRRIRTYKGIRHELGQPVRGQRTRSSFRSHSSVGVQKKKVQQAAKAAPKAEEKKK